MKVAVVAGVLLAIPLSRQVGAADDASRLGTSLTGIPIYRSVGNTNTVQVWLGGQGLNLTLCELSGMRSRMPRYSAPLTLSS